MIEVPFSKEDLATFAPIINEIGVEPYSASVSYVENTYPCHETGVTCRKVNLVIDQKYGNNWVATLKGEKLFFETILPVCMGPSCKSITITEKHKKVIAAALGKEIAA